MLKRINDLQAKFDDIFERKEKILNYQKTLDMGLTENFNQVEDAQMLLMYRVKLWSSMKQWTESTARWVTQPFESIEVDEILTICQQVSKTLLNCERNLPFSTALGYLKKICFDFKDTMPIVEALSNKNLEAFHWEQIRYVIDNRTFPLEEKCFKLGELIELNISKYQDAIVHISVTAT